ncbi:MAG: RagB/SusD family nutrient uptake outer membrane protein, partial [Pedobacter sp.]
MKKIIYILFVFAGLGTISSCKNALDAPAQSSLDESVIFSTPGLAEGAITGVLQSFGETNSYRGRFLVYYGVNNDTEVYNSLKATGDDKARLSNYNTNVNNSQMNTLDNAYAKFYEGIERANLAIKGIRTYGKIESNPQMAQILGQILTLRAVVYNDLIKGWGDVPARFEPVTTETSYLPRSDRDIIYKQLLADLNEAAGYLPWPNENSSTASVEKVNKAFAKGLRARLALAAGGYAQRLDGTVKLSSDPELSHDKMYAIAKKECLEIIASNKLRLLGYE